MIAKSQANQYAKGLFGAASPDQLDDLSERLTELATTFGAHHELVSIMASPALSTLKKEEIANAVVTKADAPPLLGALVVVMARHGELSGLGLVAEAFRKAIADARGILHGEVRFARESDIDQSDEVAMALSKATGRKVELEASFDPSLIGGFVARVGDLVFDGSLVRQMDRLRLTLLRS